MIYYGILKLSDGSKQIVSLAKRPTSRWWLKNFKAEPQYFPSYSYAQDNIKKAWNSYLKKMPYKERIPSKPFPSSWSQAAPPTSPSISTDGCDFYSYEARILTDRNPMNPIWQAYAVPGALQKRILYLNTTTYTRTTTRHQRGLLALMKEHGYFRLSPDLTWENQIVIKDLTCDYCDGSGGEEEEISGGEKKKKKECDECHETGMNPIQLENFDEFKLGGS